MPSVTTIIKINVGAIYETSHPKYKRMRVISHRGCDVKEVEMTKTVNGKEVKYKSETYIERGFACQPVDVDGRAPIFFTNEFGEGDYGVDFCLLKQLTAPAEKYVIKKDLVLESDL